MYAKVEGECSALLRWVYFSRDEAFAYKGMPDRKNRETCTLMDSISFTSLLHLLNFHLQSRPWRVFHTHEKGPFLLLHSVKEIRSRAPLQASQSNSQSIFFFVKKALDNFLIKESKTSFQDQSSERISKSTNCSRNTPFHISLHWTNHPKSCLCQAFTRLYSCCFSGTCYWNWTYQARARVSTVISPHDDSLLGHFR